MSTDAHSGLLRLGPKWETPSLGAEILRATFAAESLDQVSWGLPRYWYCSLLGLAPVLVGNLGQFAGACPGDGSHSQHASSETSWASMLVFLSLGTCLGVQKYIVHSLCAALFTGHHVNQPVIPNLSVTMR